VSLEITVRAVKILLAVFLLLFAAVAGGETNALASAPTASVVIPTAY
jgi:hypothetical protein